MKKLAIFALILMLLLVSCATPTPETIIVVVTATPEPTMIPTTATSEPISTSTSTTTPEPTATSTPDGTSFINSVIEITKQLMEYMDRWTYLFSDGLPIDPFSVLSIDWQISVYIVALDITILADDARQLKPPWELVEIYDLWLSALEHYENAAQLVIGISWIADSADDIASAMSQATSEIYLGTDLIKEVTEAISFP